MIQDRQVCFGNFLAIRAKTLGFTHELQALQHTLAVFPFVPHSRKRTASNESDYGRSMKSVARRHAVRSRVARRTAPRTYPTKKAVKQKTEAVPIRHEATASLPANVAEVFGQGKEIATQTREFVDTAMKHHMRRLPSNFKGTPQDWELLEEGRVRGLLIKHFLGQIIGCQPKRKQEVLRFLQRPNFAFLTPREREIASCLMRGLENKEIAEELRISPDTVHKHIENMKQKARVDNRTKLARWCLGI